MGQVITHKLLAPSIFGARSRGRRPPSRPGPLFRGPYLDCFGLISGFRHYLYLIKALRAQQE